jgi:predicted kinase
MADHTKTPCRLIIVCGLPGTGKTTFATALADATGALHLNTDRIRHDMGKRGKYSKAAKERIYDHLFLRTRQFLLAGRDVVLDGTFYRKKLRKPFVRLARVLNIPVVWIEVVAPEDVVLERVSRSRPYSEADFAVYQKVSKTYEPLPKQHLVLDSDELTIDEMVEKARAYCHLSVKI